MKQIAVLGSTGSIGTNCLDVVAAHAGQLSISSLTAHRSWQSLEEQCRRFQPRWAVLCDETLRDVVPRSAFPSQTELLFGGDGVERVAADAETEVVGLAGDLCRLREVDPGHGGLTPTGAASLEWLRRCEEGTP